MVTMREMLETHNHLKDQQSVWNSVLNFLSKYCSDTGGETLYGDSGEVPEDVTVAIRKRIMDEELDPLANKRRELEGSTVEVKDGKGKKQVSGKARVRSPRKGARAAPNGGSPAR